MKDLAGPDGAVGRRSGRSPNESLGRLNTIPRLSPERMISGNRW